jgi:hypothetical protein
MLLLTKKLGGSAAFATTATGPGQPVNRADVARMMDLHIRRLSMAESLKPCGVKCNLEPSHVFFDTAVLTGLSSWQFIGMAFALAVRDGNTHRPPTEVEANQWINDPTSIELIQTVVLGETDSSGSFVMSKTGSYDMYDFAGQCCNLLPLTAKQSCIQGSFVP